MTSIYDDIEDQLENFIIRKRRCQSIYLPKEKVTKDGQEIHDHIPLLVRDILQSRVDINNKGVFSLLNPIALSYRTCLVYGFVAGRGVSNKSYHKYIIDDGTGSMEFTIFDKPKESGIIRSLYNEINSLVTSGCDKYMKISESMLRLLGKSVEHIDGSRLTTGCYIMLYGRPNSFRDQICLDVISFSIDKGKSRSLEIAFHENLFDYYQSHKAQ